MINNNIPCYIRKSINNKTIDELINTVTETREHASKNKEQFVFTNERGEHLVTHTVWKQFKQIVTKMKLTY